MLQSSFKCTIWEYINGGQLDLFPKTNLWYCTALFCYTSTDFLQNKHLKFCKHYKQHLLHSISLKPIQRFDLKNTWLTLWLYRTTRKLYSMLRYIEWFHSHISNILTLVFWNVRLEWRHSVVKTEEMVVFLARTFTLLFFLYYFFNWFQFLDFKEIRIIRCKIMTKSNIWSMFCL